MRWTLLWWPVAIDLRHRALTQDRHNFSHPSRPYICASLPLPRNLTSERPAYSRSVWVLGPLLTSFSPDSQNQPPRQIINIDASRLPCLGTNPVFGVWLNTPYPRLHPISKKKWYHKANRSDEKVVVSRGSSSSGRGSGCETCQRHTERSAERLAKEGTAEEAATDAREVYATSYS